MYRNGTNLAVQNGINYFVISNDEVSYMENRMLKKESIYHDGINVKYPEKAIDAVFGSGLFENFLSGNGNRRNNNIWPGNRLMHSGHGGKMRRIGKISLPTDLTGSCSPMRFTGLSSSPLA